jgi:hypothetical protein
MRKFYSLLLLILFSSCERQDDLFSLVGYIRTGKNTFQLRLKTSPVGYIDGDLNSVDLVSGRLNHHRFIMCLY